MNLGLLPLGWVHLIASLAALVVGIFVLLRPKGTPDHSRSGLVYAVTILFTSITALGIYRHGVFFFPHWMAIVAPIVTTVGILAARFRIPRKAWLHLHLTCLLTSFYILVAIGVNEVVLRVDVLRQSAPILGPPAVGLTHFAMLLLFLTVIGYFNAGVLRQSQRKRPLPSREYGRRFVEQPHRSTGQD
jgi:uncharacterized membrane protein